MARLLKSFVKISPNAFLRRHRFSNSSAPSIFIADVISSKNDGCLNVRWPNDDVSAYPFIFLRDNCLCPKCFNFTAKARSINTTATVDFNIKPQRVYVGHDKITLVCHWPDGHVSEFPSTWLHERKFPESDCNAERHKRLSKIRWNKNLTGSIPFVHYESFMKEDQVARTHIGNVMTYGLSLVRNAPIQSGVVAQVGARMASGFLKRTHYGDVFTVQSKPNPNNLAYTAEALPLHVDLACKEYQPGIQMLHCLEQSQEEHSGTSLLADGLNISDIIRRQDPDAFELLTKVKFMFNDIGADCYGEFDFQIERPIIGLNGDNEVIYIALNNQIRSSFINASAKTVRKCYKAYYTLMEIVHHPDNVVPYKMKPGDLLCFDNQRVLHGRTGYDPTKSARWLEGAYLDWDEVNSKYRVLSRRLDLLISEHNQV